MSKKVAHPNDFRPVEKPNPTMKLAKAAAASRDAVRQQQAQKPEEKDASGMQFDEPVD
jgi:hypothetical protein